MIVEVEERGCLGRRERRVEPLPFHLFFFGGAQGASESGAFLSPIFVYFMFACIFCSSAS